MSVEEKVDALQEEQEITVDATVQCFIDSTYTTVELLVSPPQGDGADITLEQLHSVLAQNKVVYGINEMALQRLSIPVYNQKVVVARARPAQDGKNGVCREKFSREVKKTFFEREDGSVDYKELDIINDVKAGTVICDITLPTEAVEGIDVLGRPLKGRNGVKAVLPIGTNTKLSEDGLRVEAVVDGNLSFNDGRFMIETTYQVQNVNYTTGNITFSGDVVVNGDVEDGFEIHAGGRVVLRGQAGAAVIKAEGNIVIEQGINGTGRAVLEAGDTIDAGFIENCIIRATNKVKAQSIINCQVECEGDIEVTGGKGIICGGKVTAFGSIVAKEIGNDFNTLTTINIGVTPKLLKERKRIVGQLEDVGVHLQELMKNVSYIERLVAEGRKVPPDRIQTLKRVQIQLPLTERKKEQLEASLAELEEKMFSINSSTLIADIIYPPTKVAIGMQSANVTDQRSKTRVYRNDDGELVFGTS